MRRIKLVISLFTFMNLLLAQPETTTNPGPPNPLLCTNGDLEIIRFNGKKVYKVVVGIPFKYGARHKPEDKPYSWELGHGFWPLTPTPIELTGDATINKLPINNSDFGETHGVLKLSSKTNITTLSTKNVKVFFKRYDPKGPVGSVPNWFYYWNQLVTSDLIVKSIPIFDAITESWNSNPPDIIFDLVYNNTGKYNWATGKSKNNVTYGSNQFKFQPSRIEYPLNSGIQVGTGFPYTANIIIGEGCGYWNLEHDNIDGIQIFYETILHEIYHTKLFFDMYPNGYSSTYDKDLDYYSDTEEIRYNNEYPNRKQFHINDPLLKDVTDQDYKAADYDLKIKLKAGTMYEEDICREKQKIGSDGLNDSDWSYDPDDKVIGKNWKK